MRISSALSRLLLVGCIISVVAPFSVGQGERPQRGQGGGGPGGPGGGRGGFGGGGGGGIASLLTIKEVREELKMDEEQVKDMDAFTKELRDEMQTQFAGLGGGRGGRGGPGGGGGAGGAAPDMTKIREAMTSMQLKSESKLGDVLDPIQMDRLVGLFIQRDGVRTLNSKTISTRLGITEDQKAKIAEQEKAAGEEMLSLFGGGGGGGGGGDNREKMDKIRKDSEEKITGVLTAAQKAKMEELKGAKFEFPAQPARGGPGGGRGGNPQ